MTFYRLFNNNFFLGNTTNLNGHLKNVHGNILSRKVNAKVCSVEPTESQEQHETHPDDPGPSTSKANIDESTENSDKDSMINMTQNTFMSSFKRQKTINESFAFLNSFKEGGQKSEKITHAIMYMVCKDNQPLSIVEDKGNVHLMNVVAPNFKIPSLREISRRIFLFYDSMKNMFIDKLKNVQHFALTTDIQTRSHIGITIHFVDNYIINSGLLGVFELDEKHTSEYIASKLVEVCDKWSISITSIVAVTTDGAANMIKAIDLAFDKKR